MSTCRNSPFVGRRNFLKGATLVGAAAFTPRIARAELLGPRPVKDIPILND